MSVSTEGQFSGPATPAILYVDDEPQSIKYFNRAFGSEFRILTAGSGAEAQRVLESEVAAAGVGVLVTDQRMPVETGVQLLDRVKDRYPTIIRLLTTAYADLNDAVAAVNRGEIHRYILKPWDLESLRAELRASMRLYRERQVQQDLLQARRATMAALASYVAHELATPLASIATAAAGLERYLPALLDGYCSGASGVQVDPIPREVLDVLQKTPALVQESANRSRLLIRLLLMNAGSSREGAAPRERVSVSRVVEEALGGYPFNVRERDLLRVEGGDFQLSGSATLLIHVLQNLIKNALDAVLAAGKGGVHLTVEPGPDWNRLAVTDTGVGIAPEVMPRIFDEFFSLKGPGRGTGMGLPFCRRVMMELGGEIVCQSVLGEYTRVELCFPPLPGLPDFDDAMPEDAT
jgi:two-component system response regulator PhcR